MSDQHMDASWLQRVKYWLVSLGAANPIAQNALRVSSMRAGVRLAFADGTISLRKDRDTLVLRSRDLFLVPEMVRLHGHYFQTLEAEQGEGGRVLDFSRPSMHRYRRSGIEIRSPHVAEDDSMPLYTRRFMPQPGMTVFDVGAHAGLTAIEFSRLVGSNGRVFAFEPDNYTRDFLQENLKRLAIKNVTVLDVALAEKSGEAPFSMDGTQAAGLVETLVYASEDSIQSVKVTTLHEACSQLGVLPDFLKSDIEGGELGMVRGSTEFITRSPIHMSFETHRLRDGSDTAQLLAPILTACGYSVEPLIEAEGRQQFMFATPRAA